MSEEFMPTEILLGLGLIYPGSGMWVHYWLTTAEGLVFCHIRVLDDALLLSLLANTLDGELTSVN